MSRIIALDFGTKRTGVAITDPLQIIASGLKTVSTIDLLDFLNEIIPSENIETIVIGEPKQKDGTPSDIEIEIKKMIRSISKLFPTIKIERIDERYSSKMAFQTMIDSGLKKKQRRNKALIDEISATIILQNYLQQIR
ncbi:MAG: Holliday junction resolvase RuvX [Flavobacteriales bacterium]